MEDGVWGSERLNVADGGMGMQLTDAHEHGVECKWGEQKGQEEEQMRMRTQKQTIVVEEWRDECRGSHLEIHNPFGWDKIELYRNAWFYQADW